MPRIPFSLCRVTLMPDGMWLATSVGMPMPRFTYQPSRNSRAIRFAIWFLSRAMRDVKRMK